MPDEFWVETWFMENDKLTSYELKFENIPR